MHWTNSAMAIHKRLRVVLLKIDQSFACIRLDDPDGLAILEGVIGLATASRCDCRRGSGVWHRTAALGLLAGTELGQ